MSGVRVGNGISKMGYTPEPMKCIANGLHAYTDNQTVYSNPAGHHRVAAVSTASALTYTARQVLGGVIKRDPNGASRTDTLPTAALLVAAYNGVAENSSVTFDVMNTSDANETITIAMGSGITRYTNTATPIVYPGSKMRLRIVFTNISPGSEAATLYNENAEDFGVLTATGATSITTPIVLRARRGYVITVASSLAAGAAEDITITNSLVSANSKVIAGIIYGGAGNAVCSVRSVTSGSIVVRVQNIHSADALDDTYEIVFDVYW